MICPFCSKILQPLYKQNNSFMCRCINDFRQSPYGIEFLNNNIFVHVNLQINKADFHDITTPLISSIFSTTFINIEQTIAISNKIKRLMLLS